MGATRVDLKQTDSKVVFFMAVVARKVKVVVALEVHV